MPDAPNVTQCEVVHRSVRLRLLPGSRAEAHQMAGTAGTCRLVWNHFLARQTHAYRCWQEFRIGDRPSPTRFSMYKEFTALRRDPQAAWLQAYGCAEVRYVLKYLADAYAAFFRGQRAHPTFKRKFDRQDGFTIPERVQVRDHQLRVPRIGWVQLRGGSLYAHGQPVQARIRQEGTRARPKWYAYLTYAVPADAVRTGAATGILGLDRNVGQATDSQGTVYPMTDLCRLKARVARKQRQQARKRRGSVRSRRIGGQLTRLQCKQKRIRSNDTHHISRALADKAHTLVVEDLHTQGMTKSARGTKDSPGTNVKAKVGLNRSILASNWGQLAQRLRYKCGHFVTVDPRHTSQTCHQCGHVSAANRQTQAVFHCQRCDLRMHADHNAALNMLVRYTRTVARGTGATARREAFPPGTSMTREHDVLEYVYSSI